MRPLNGDALCIHFPRVPPRLPSWWCNYCCEHDIRAAFLRGRLPLGGAVRRGTKPGLTTATPGQGRDSTCKLYIPGPAYQAGGGVIHMVIQVTIQVVVV